MLELLNLIRLRVILKSDLRYLMKWFNDPEVTQYLRIFFPSMEVFEEKWINDLATIKRETDVVFMIEVRVGKRWVPIGTCGLHRINWHERDADLGMAIGEKKFWSNGYGTQAAKLLVDYAFLQLNMHRVSSSAYGFNTRSIKMQERVGMKREGVVRKAIYCNGKYHDRVLSGILREEWEEMRK